MTVSLNTRLEALAKIKSGSSIRDAAGIYGVSVRTVQSWLKWQREGGPVAAGRKADIAKEAFLLKERFPGCTVRRAVKFLTRRGYTLSDRTVWEIWRHFGLAGYRKDSATASYLTYIAHTTETERAQTEAERLLKDGDIAGAAIKVNEMPTCPNAETLLAIPDERLSLRRRLDKLYPLSDSVPLSQSFQKAKVLRRVMFARGLIYSGLRAGVLEQKNLLLMGWIKEGISLTTRIESLLPKRGDPALQFIFHYTKAQLLCRSFDNSQARQSIAKCRILARSLKQPFYAFFLCAFYGETGDNRRAIALLERLLPRFCGAYRRKALQDLALRLDMAGRSAEALKIFPRPSLPEEPLAYHYTKIQCRNHLSRGHIKEAVDLAHRTIQNPGCLRSMPALFPVVNDLYCLYAGLGRASDQRGRLKRITTMCLKEGNFSAASMGKVLLESKQNMPEPASGHPQVRMANLLKRSNNEQSLKPYRQACRLADRFGLCGRFRMLCLAYPWPVRELLKLGRPTGLPRAMLRLPVFNDESIVVRLDILGKMRINKGGVFLRIEQAPKEMALLTHLALIPGHRLPVDGILENFWQRSKSPMNSLAHALVRLRRTLGIPSHLLTVSEDEVRSDIHFITDYEEWLAAIKIYDSCQNAGRKDVARQEMLKALSLFRGEPFRGKYDNWSDERRNEMMLSFERRAMEFAKAEQEAGRNATTRRVLKKILGIDPSSDEARVMLKGMDNK